MVVGMGVTFTGLVDTLRCLNFQKQDNLVNFLVRSSIVGQY